jgi:two-component system sensor histidine kinase FlrB
MSPDERQRLQELEEAFALFNATSEQLAQSYHSLQQQVVELTQELAQARSERLLQLAEKERVADRLARLLALLPAAVLVLDQLGKITEANATAQHWLAVPLQGQYWQQVLASVGVRSEVAGDWLLHDQRILNVSETPLDKALGKIVLLMDVTEQRTLASQLSQHQRLRSMGEMAASLAHQIRTPLAAALLYASQLSLPNVTEDKRSQMSDKILARLRHLEHLVTDMLQYAKGGQSGSSCIEVNDWLQQVVQICEATLQSSNSQLQVDQWLPDQAVQGDVDALITAVQSLVVNAIDVVKVEAKITLRAEAQDDWIKVCVCDQGPGIHADLHEKIFEPFYTSRAQGTGLGLAVTRAVAQAHHGRVTVSSQLGQGAEFCIWLPKWEEME